MSGFKWGKRWWGFGIAVASAGPYANNLHLAACSRRIITSTPHHSILQAACSFWRPTNSDKALKALISQVNQQKITYCCFFTSSKHSKTEQHRQHVNTILHGHKPNKYILYTATVTVAQLFILHPTGRLMEHHNTISSLFPDVHMQNQQKYFQLVTKSCG